MLDAALELFAEQGYDNTTAGDIAARAGVTERTFFRHFADKREVLFVGPVSLDEVATSAIAALGDDVPPLSAALAAVRAVAAELGAARTREQAATRASIVAATPALRERELLKMASMTEAITRALVGRGAPQTVAGLAAHNAGGVFAAAFARWVSEDGEPDFARCIDDATEVLRQLG